MASPGGPPGAPAPAPAVPASPTPPLGLVALLDRADLHPAVAQHLRSGPRAPLECAGVDDIAAASSVIGARKRTRASTPCPPPPRSPRRTRRSRPLAAGDASSRPAIVRGSRLRLRVPPPSVASPSRPAPKPGWCAHRAPPRGGGGVRPHELVEGGRTPGSPSSPSSTPRARRRARRPPARGGGGGRRRPSAYEDRASAIRRQARVDARASSRSPSPHRRTPFEGSRVSAATSRPAVRRRARPPRALFPGAEPPGRGNGAASRLQGGRLLGFEATGKARAGGTDRVRSLLLGARRSRSGDGDGPIGAERSGRVAACFSLGAMGCWRRRGARTVPSTLAAARAPAAPTAVASAVERQRLHCAALKRPPGWLPRRRAPEHWLWAAAQHEAFGEALAARIETAGTESSGVFFAAKETKVSGVPRACLPGFHFHAAADAIEKSIRATEALGVDEDAEVGASVASGAAVATAHTLAARQIALLSAARRTSTRRAAEPRRAVHRARVSARGELPPRERRVAAKTRLRSVADAYRRGVGRPRAGADGAERCAGRTRAEARGVPRARRARAGVRARRRPTRGGRRGRDGRRERRRRGGARTRGVNVEVLVGD